jgi:TP901 family phage tail tape measure protein
MADFNDALVNILVQYQSLGQQKVLTEMLAVNKSMMAMNTHVIKGHAAMALAGRENIAQVRALDRAVSGAMRPTAKSFGEAARNMNVLSQAMQSGRTVGIGTIATYNNMIKGTKTYYTESLKPLSTIQKMRIGLDAAGQQITALGMKWQNTAKNMQWTGRQMMVGLTLPIAMAAGLAIKQWQSVNKQIVRVAKVADNFNRNWADPGAINATASAQDNLLRSARALGHEYAAVDEIVLAAMGDFAAMGYSTKKTLTDITDLTLKTSMLGEVDISDATLAVRTVMAVYGESVKGASDTLAVFNQIENDTALSAKELIAAWPEVAQSAKQFGMTAEDSAAMLAAMYHQGIPATEGAHALKFALTSLVKPTKATVDQIESFAQAAPAAAGTFTAIINGTLRGRKAIEQMSLAYQDIENTFGPAKASEFLSNLVGKRQANRILALMNEVRSSIQGVENDYTAAVQAGSDVVKAQQTVVKEMAKIRESDAFRMDQAKADFKAFLTDIGKTLMPTALSMFEDLLVVAKKFVKILQDNPALQKLIIGFLALLATIGPLVYISGQLFTAFSTLTKTFGKMIPDLSRVNLLFMTSAERARLLNGQIGIVGDTAVDFRGKWRKMGEQILANIKAFLGFGPVAAAAETAQNSSLVATNALTAAIRAQTAAYMANSSAAATNAGATITASSTATQAAILAQAADMGTSADIDDTFNYMGRRARGKAASGNLITPVKKLTGGVNRSIFGAQAKGMQEVLSHGDDYASVMAEAANAMKKVEAATPKVSPFARVMNMLKSVIGVGGPGALSRGIGGLASNVGTLSAKMATGGRAATLFAKPLAGIATILGGKGAVGIGGGAATGGLAGVGAGGWIVAIIVALIAAMPLFAKFAGHWDSFWKGVQKSFNSGVGLFKSAWEDLKWVFDSLLRSLRSIIDPITDGFNSIAEAIGGGGKGSKKSGWEKMGMYWAAIVPIIAAVAKALAVIAKILAIILEIVAKIAGFLLKWLLIKPIVGIIKGMIKGFKALADVVGWVGDRLKGIANVVGDIAGGIGGMVGGLGGMVGGALGIGGGDKTEEKVKKIGYYIRQATKDSEKFGMWWKQKYGMTFNNALKTGNIQTAMSQWAKMGKIAAKQWKAMPKELRQKTTFREFRIKVALEGGFDTTAFFGQRGAYKYMKKVEKWLKKEPPKFRPVADPEAAAEEAKKWRNAFNDALKAEVDKLKEQAMKNFEAMSAARLKVFDDQIKGIEAQAKAEQELYETQEYLNNRRKMLDDYNITSENYRRNRSLAIYEGRYDDARDMDIQYQADTKTHNESLGSLDEERRRTLVENERDLQKERIEVQKEAMAEQLEIQKQALQDQLDAITKYTPKNVQALADMVGAMNGVLTGYGAGTLGLAMDVALNTWGVSMETARKDLLEEAYLTGKDIVESAAQGMELNPDWQTWADSRPQRYSKKQQRAQELFNTNKDAWAEFYRRGGTIYHSGGQVGGGSPRDVPAILQTGEYVIQRDAVNKLGTNYLDSLNSYHKGGEVFGDAYGTGVYSLMRAQVMRFLEGTGKFGGYTKDEIKAKYAPKLYPRMGGMDGSGMGHAEGIFAISGGQYMVDWLQNLLLNAFPDMAPNIAAGSKFRHGAGFHGLGQALDIGSNPGNRLDRLVDIFNYLAQNIARFDIVELIHKNEIFHPWDGWNRYNPMDHYDHVHVATGSWKEGMLPLMNGGRVMVDNLPALLHKGEMVVPSNAVEKYDGQMGGDTYIVVDTFIGQEQWFKQMMKQYNIKELPAEQRKRGTINRTVSSRKDNSVRYV